MAKQRNVPVDDVARRGGRFVDKVLQAALELLARDGLERMAIPDVAERAGVNKTSIYRRWPTKVELVRAALGNSMGAGAGFTTTGELRQDLLNMAAASARFLRSPLGRASLGVLLANTANPDVRALANAVRKGAGQGPRAVFELAMARGEIPWNADVELAVTVVSGACLHRLVVEHGTLSKTFLEQVIDLALVVVRRAVTKRRAPARKPPRVTPPQPSARTRPGRRSRTAATG